MSAVVQTSPEAPLQSAWRLTPARTAFLCAVLVLSVAVGVQAVLQSLAFFRRTSQVIPGWQESQYWLDYEGGFVRRGLPGEILSWFSGHLPGLEPVQWAGLVVSALGVLAVLVLAVRTASLPETALGRLLVFVLVVDSPFAVNLALHDLGRFDALGWLVLAALATLPLKSGTGGWVPAVVAGTLIAVAVACEEFLLPLFLPLVLIAIWRRGRPARWWSAVGAAALVMLPALVITVASVLVQPSPGVVQAAVAHAVSVSSDVEQENAISVVGEPFSFSFVQSLEPLTVVASVVVLAGYYALAGGLVWWVAGRRAPRVAAALLGYYALCALGLSVLGIDYRRWWTLAFLGFLACLVRIGRDAGAWEPPWRPRVDNSRVVWALIAVFLLLAVPAQRFPIYPTWDEPDPTATSAPSSPAVAADT